jgi:hypothetical protein
MSKKCWNGTPIGYQHSWNYSDSAIEFVPAADASSEAPRRADFFFDSLKTSVKQKRAFGPNKGAAYHWFLAARMRMEAKAAAAVAVSSSNDDAAMQADVEHDSGAAADASASAADCLQVRCIHTMSFSMICCRLAQVTMIGPKYKLGHRYDEKGQWSYENGKAPSKAKATAKSLRHASAASGAVEWSCASCTLVNAQGCLACAACGGAAPTAAPAEKSQDQTAAVLQLPIVGAVRFLCRRTTWQETKAANDRWTVHFCSQWTPVDAKNAPLPRSQAVALCKQLHGSEWLVIAEQIAVKLDPSSYMTNMRAQAHYTGNAAHPAACSVTAAKLLRTLYLAADAAAKAKPAAAAKPTPIAVGKKRIGAPEVDETFLERFLPAEHTRAPAKPKEVEDFVTDGAPITARTAATTRKGKRVAGSPAPKRARPEPVSAMPALPLMTV